MLIRIHGQRVASHAGDPLVLAVLAGDSVSCHPTQVFTSLVKHVANDSDFISKVLDSIDKPLNPLRALRFRGRCSHGLFHAENENEGEQRASECELCQISSCDPAVIIPFRFTRRSPERRVRGGRASATLSPGTLPGLADVGQHEMTNEVGNSVMPTSAELAIADRVGWEAAPLHPV